MNRVNRFDSPKRDICAKVGSSHWFSISQHAEMLKVLTRGIPEKLPKHPGLDETVPHAPKRKMLLNETQKRLAVKNALRYFPPHFHKVLAREFYEELEEYGHIYMYRFRPTEYEMKAYSHNDYPGHCIEAKCMMFQIMNNLDRRVAQFPNELITYGGNGTVFSNWVQYLLTMKYLSTMENDQTLVMYSGHPMGLFPSRKDSPRCIITNGLMVPNFSSADDYNMTYALGNTIYGQMTAGSWAYIGPQGIVHGTTITILNAGRKYLGLEDLGGKVYISSGLGGMSGAQAKAGVICGCVCVIAEINESALKKRYEQGWLTEYYDDLPKLVNRIKEAKAKKQTTSIGYLGNIVDLWEFIVEMNERTEQEEDKFIPELASDQTSCHIPFSGGYYPVGMSVEESNEMMKSDPEQFRERVQDSLKRHVIAIKKLTDEGMKFWDYGNSFLFQCSAVEGMEEFLRNKDPNVSHDFIYPSYVEDIMGDIFSLGFGPFRWICSSNDPSDLRKTDEIAAKVIKELMPKASTESKKQFSDNLLWIEKAEENKLVVGSQARILYSDTRGRMRIALRFNEEVKKGNLKGPVIVSRDHHDVSGTDSPFRETSNIKDGSYKTADMSVQTFVGNAFRGATWISLHNGGGVGFGLAMNGGFGLVLDGSLEAESNARDMLFWDVNNGIARRSWCGNRYATQTIKEQMEDNKKLVVTLVNETNDDIVEEAFQQKE